MRISDWSSDVCSSDLSDGSLHSVVALGVGVTPEYDGAEDLRIIPFGIADIEWGGVSFAFRGLRGRADLVPDSRFAAGPVVNARLSREDEAGPGGPLPEIDMAIEDGASDRRKDVR